MFICPYCNKEFKSQKGLGAHLNKIHIDKKIIKYEKCKNPKCDNNIEIIVYDNIELLHSKNCCSRECYNEYIKFSRKKDIICETCNQHFTSITIFKNHKCFKKYDFKCKYCDKEYSTEGMLRKHILNNHKEYVKEIEIKCTNPNCNNTISTLKIGDYVKPYRQTCSNDCLKQIISINSKKETPFKCKACNEKFSSIELLNKHFKIRHQKEEYQFECLICKAKFKNKDQLHSHYYQYHKNLIIEEKVKCKNENCNNYTSLLKINDYVIKQNNEFCSKNCSSWYNGITIERYLSLNKNKINDFLYKGRLWYNYIDNFGIKHRLQGSYELALAKKLDEMNVKFISHPKGIKYIRNNKLTYYFPDFYIPSKNLYVDTKSYYFLNLSGDKFKLFREQNPNINLVILTENLLECYGITKKYIKNNLKEK